MQLKANLRKMTVVISKNAIPDNNTIKMMTLSPIPETYPEEAVGTTAEVVKVLIGGIIDTDQITSRTMTLSQIPTETCPKTSYTNPFTRYNDRQSKIRKQQI